MVFNQFTTSMGTQQGCDELNGRFDKNIGHSHEEENGGKPIGAKGIQPKAITADKLSDNAITDKLGYKPLNPAEIGNLNLPGIPDYIASGRKITQGNGLQVNLSSGVDYISGKTLSLTSKTLDLPARSASLIYDKSDGTSGYVSAANPMTFIDNNTVALWVFNKTVAGEQVPNSAVGLSSAAVVNNLVPNGGLASVDGWCDYAIQGDGATGYYTSQNSTGFMPGNSEREIDILYTHVKSSNGTICGYGETSDNRFYINTNNDNTLQIYQAYNVLFNVNYTLNVGATYLIKVLYNNNTLSLYINGALVWTANITLNTTVGKFFVLRDNSAGYSGNIIHYIELRNKMRTPAQISQMANKLCLPTSYTTPQAEYPNVAETGYHEWKFDEAGGGQANDSAGTLDGTNYGTIAVPSEIGLGYARKFSGGAYLNCGSYTFPSEFTIISIINPATFGPTAICSNRPSAGTSGTLFSLDSTGHLLLGSNTGVTSTGTLSTGISNFVACTFQSNLAKFYVNSPYVDTTNSLTISAVTNTLLIGKDAYGGSGSGGYYYNGLIDYFAIIPRALSQAEIAVIYNKLMQQKKRNIISDLLPQNSISLGFIRTDSSKVIQIDDSSYMYGRREKAFGGNRRVFLGWKYFNGSPILKWDNPFGTRKIRLYYTWAQDANGTNEVSVNSVWGTGTAWYGIETDIVTSSSYITAIPQPTGVIKLNSVWQTSGYIGCYAEVLEDD